MISQITRDEALNLLKTYNKEPFHILHGLTVEGVMMRRISGESADCSTILILSFTRSSTAQKRRSC